MYASENTTWTIPRLVVPRACHDNDLMKQALSIECDRIFCERTVPVCAITVLIVSGLMALLTFQNIDYPLLQIALILLLLTSLAGIGLAERLRHANLPRHWVLTILLWMTVVSGGVWGLVGFAMTAISDATTCFICLLVLAGAMASGVLMLCAIPNLNRFHLLAVSFPTALGYTLHSEQPNPALASLIICFALYLAVLSNRIFDRLLDTIRITLKYNAMPEYLRRAKNQMIQSLSKAKQEIAYHSQCHSTTLSMLPGVRYHAERHHGCWMLTDISNNAQSLFLYKPELLLGQRMSHLFELINVNARNISDQELIESARSKTCFEVEYSIINGEGKQRCIVERGRARFNASGKLASVEGILIDVTENPGLSKKHKEPGTYDALTAIPDRDEFCYRLQTSLGTVNHHPKGHTVILMNLDHFKIINDIYGHTAADKLLCQVSRRLSVSMQEGDTLARVSEDKFAVLLKGCDEQQARRFAQSLREMLEKDWYSWGKKRFDIKASFGIASTKYQCQDAETILNHAEQACALVKEQGLDCTQIYRDRDIKIVNCQKEKYWAL
ncbi:MAG: sensor domain-containing diguanylate cyclase, partial [Gammaproteobacteria bacterium]|nr:sensor domain-containing diguanylate cyclase [Gammaproteobacteria bacterium]